MPRRPTIRLPLRAAERVGGIVPFRDANGYDVLFIEAEDDGPATQRLIAFIEALTALPANYGDMEDAAFRPALRRIAGLVSLAVVAVSTVGITLGFAAALS